MRLGINFAMDEEREAFLALFDQKKASRDTLLDVYEITTDKNTIYAVKSGIGKVQAASIATTFLTNYTVDYLLSSGIAGGYNTHIGALIIGTKYIQHDVDVRAFGYPLTQIPGLPAYFTPDKKLLSTLEKTLPKEGYQTGTIATGDQFITAIHHLDAVFKQYPDIKAFEMETAALAQVAYIYKIPFLALRTISDVVGSVDQFEKYENTIKVTFDQNAQYLKTFCEAL